MKVCCLDGWRAGGRLLRRSGCWWGGLLGRNVVFALGACGRRIHFFDNDSTTTSTTTTTTTTTDKVH